ncbi:MAG: electron transfer flavoprotein-ubiquinone oxidoreductase [Desulfobacterium sp.]
MTIERERIDFDVLFVGGGPANLAGAIHLMTLAAEKKLDLEVALIEKGKKIGAHSLSGAVFNPRALEELIPDYLDKGFPLEKEIRGDRLYYLTKTGSHKLPWTPPAMENKGFHTVSLAKLNRWLADIAESLGVCIFPGFAGKEVLFGEDGKTIVGVRTGDKGLDREGNPKKNCEPGMDLIANVTIFGEGPKGSLVEEIDQRLHIFPKDVPQVFETGIKEVIQLPEDNFFTASEFNDIHTMGYPLGLNTPGGGFVYEMDENRVALGFITGLSYEDPMLDIYDEFMKFKTHPLVAKIIAEGKVVEQGARTISSGGYYSLPELAVDGAMFVGGCASVQDLPSLKGVHLSMKSGMLAAEAAVKAAEEKCFTREALGVYTELFKNSWVNEVLYEGRNFAQALSRKGLAKLIHLGAQTLTQGRGWFDPMSHHGQDNKTMKHFKKDNGEKAVDKITYDGKLHVDKLTGVFLSKTMHREDQPCHLLIHDLSICLTDCYEAYRNPCTRFCPGNVYEMEINDDTGERRLKLNPSNCLHCKTCEIKDPFQNILWTCPEGGDGPNYTVL